MRILIPFCLFICACSNPIGQQVVGDLVKDAAAAGEGFLVAGKEGAIAYGTRQEIKNLHELVVTISGKQPKKVTP